MRKVNKSLVAVAALITLLLGVISHASVFTYNGKEVSKGEAIKILVKDPKAKILKVDQVELNDRTGTLKNIPKN